MKLEVGASLGSYEVVSPIGAGGMGEVWLARDTRLDRDVAIKLLPETMTENPERVARFEREAKLLASFNHTHIAAIHGFEDVEGSRMLVMEYVEGETLAHRLQQGPLEIEEAMSTARQMAEALEAAHDKGVIHRDLKPANVMIRPDGTVKVLDFGLAKAMTEESVGNTATNSPTITANYTRPGVVLGTAAYMSPEQARGRPLDKRTDIWSFGIIFYECLTGAQLFPGETATDSMGAIMHKEPDWSLLPTNTPPMIQLLLRRCLTKERKKRLQDMGDARVEIEEAIHDPTSSSLGLAQLAVEDHGRVRSGRKSSLGLILAFLLGGVIVAGLVVMFTPKPEPLAVRRFEIASDMEPRNPSISPDGTMVAFASDETIYVRKLDTLETRTLWDPGEGKSVSNLFWSADSQWLAAQVNFTIWKISIASGNAIKIAEEQAAFAGSWTDDGFILLASFKDGTLIKIPANGGEPRPILKKLDTELHIHAGWPLPDGRGVLFVPHAIGEDANTLCVLTPEGERQELYKSAHEIGFYMYSHTGHIMYGQDKAPKGTWALPFSLNDLKVTGEPFLVLPGFDKFSVSRAGDLIYNKGEPNAGGKNLVWVDKTGNVLGKIGPTLFGAMSPRISPDGEQVAVAAEGLDENSGSSPVDMWMVNVRRGTAMPLAVEKGMQRPLQWSADSKRIAYSSMTQGFTKMAIRARQADGSGESEILIDDALEGTLARDWSYAVFSTGAIGDDVWIVAQTPGDDSTRTVFQRSEDWDMSPTLSPGGDLVAYVSGDVMSQRGSVFIRPFPDGEGRWQVTMEHAWATHWSPEGDFLYFVTTNGDERNMVQVPVAVENGRVDIGDPVELFSLKGNRLQEFDLSPDGERFLMLQDVVTSNEEKPEEGIVVIENWYEEFRPRSK
ncbi:MAG: serine/threonine-protein kinase [Planctomycetota bacterium]|jgi:serine/threonine-protein kinase